MNDNRVLEIEHALLRALNESAAPADTWGVVKTAIGLLLAEVLSDHEAMCGCGRDHAPQDRIYMEAVLETAKDMLARKRTGEQTVDLANLTPKGTA